MGTGQREREHARRGYLVRLLIRAGSPTSLKSTRSAYEKSVAWKPRRRPRAEQVRADVLLLQRFGQIAPGVPTAACGFTGGSSAASIENLQHSRPRRDRETLHLPWQPATIRHTSAALMAWPGKCLSLLTEKTSSPWISPAISRLAIRDDRLLSVHTECSRHIFYRVGTGALSLSLKDFHSPSDTGWPACTSKRAFFVPVCSLAGAVTGCFERESSKGNVRSGPDVVARAGCPSHFFDTRR